MTIYSVGFSGVAVTAQQDLFSVVAPSSGVVILHRCVISQVSDYGDAQDEGLTVQITRGATTAGSGGTVITPGVGNAIEQAGPAFTGTVRRNDTTRATGGTIAVLHVEAWPVRGVFDFLPTPELRPVVSPSQRLVVELGSTPADSLTVNGTFVFEWLGG